MTPTHYVVSNGATVFVKEANFFASQGGLVEDWGKDWKPVVAESIGAARKQGAKLFNVKLSFIYKDEV